MQDHPRRGPYVPQYPAHRRPLALYKAGMHDLSFAMPDVTDVGCGALCNEISYFGQVPAIPDSRDPRTYDAKID